MNKREIAEIKRTLRNNSGCLKKIVAYFVTADKRNIPLKTTSVNLMTNEELEHYTSIFKGVLSGREGSKLHSLELRNEAEKSGGPQDFLLSIRDSELSDSDLLEKYIQIIMDNYITDDSYFILFLHGCYDIPMKTKNDESSGESEEIYNFVIGCICPAKLSKTGLSYNISEQEIKDLDAKYIVPAPSFGFLFPAFNDRSTDIHSILIYSKKLSVSQEAMFSQVLGCNFPLSEEDHVDAFSRLSDTAFGGSCSFTDATNVQMSLYDMLRFHEEGKNPEPLTVDGHELADVFEENYATNMDSFNTEYNQLLGDTRLPVENLVSDKTNIKTESFNISIPTENLHLISLREIDGIKYLVLKPNDNQIEINGVSTSIE